MRRLQGEETSSDQTWVLNRRINKAVIITSRAQDCGSEFLVLDCEGNGKHSQVLHGVAGQRPFSVLVPKADSRQTM